LVSALVLVAAILLAACAPAATPVPPTPTKKVPPTAPPAAKEGVAYKIGFAPAITGGGSFLGEPERNVAEIIAERY